MHSFLCQLEVYTQVREVNFKQIIVTHVVSAIISCITVSKGKMLRMPEIIVGRIIFKSRFCTGLYKGLGAFQAGDVTNVKMQCVDKQDPEQSAQRI